MKLNMFGILLIVKYHHWFAFIIRPVIWYVIGWLPIPFDCEICIFRSSETLQHFMQMFTALSHNKQMSLLSYPTSIYFPSSPSNLDRSCQIHVCYFGLEELQLQRKMAA